MMELVCAAVYSGSGLFLGFFSGSVAHVFRGHSPDQPRRAEWAGSKQHARVCCSFPVLWIGSFGSSWVAIEIYFMIVETP